MTRNCFIQSSALDVTKVEHARWERRSAIDGVAMSMALTVTKLDSCIIIVAMHNSAYLH